MSGPEPGLVHRSVDRVGERGVIDHTLDARPARMPGQCQGEDVVASLQRGENGLPCARCQ